MADGREDRRLTAVYGVGTPMVGRMAARWRAATPADRVFLGYVAFSGALALLFGWRLSPGLWLGLTAMHLGILATGLWWSGRPLHYPSLAGFLRDAYPFLFIVLLYWELRYFAPLFSAGYHDAVILRLEEALFGEQLAMTLSERLHHMWLSEAMHFFYGIYWVLLPLTAVSLYLRGRVEGFRELVFVEVVVFLACYLVFIFFPVAGPHYQFPAIGGHLSEGPMYKFVHWVLEDGGSKGAAFPSSHVAVAVAILLVSWRHDRFTWVMMLPLVVGLTIGTVYGRFHYGVDALAGVAAALLLVPLARRVRRELGARRGAEMGNAAEPSPV